MFTFGLNHTSFDTIMKIAIVGYGKMGKAIAHLAEKKGHEVALRISSANQGQINSISDYQIDVAIEFSTPKSAVPNLEKIIKQKIPVVCGTTAWHQQYDRICRMTMQYDSALLYASNYSIGMNLMFRMNAQMAQMMSKFGQYQPSITESHHIQKIDAPSGTAVTLADQILLEYPKFSGWQLQEHEHSLDQALPIKSIREGKVIGTHEVIYQSNIDQISIKHHAHNRDGFAQGALLAAEYIYQKKGVYTMEDVLNWALNQ